VTDVFEPGSVNKVITAAARSRSGLVRPDEVFTVPDHYVVGRSGSATPTRTRTEQWSFAEIMAPSSNVGTIMVAERLGEELLYEATCAASATASAPGSGSPASPGLLPPWTAGG
jgi:cell division protein FtsI (penicillin-binding protein 3)